MTGLPLGWTWTTLGEVCSTGSGGTPRAGTPEYYNGDIPWAVIGDLNDSLVTETKSSITEEGLHKSAASLVSSGTILMAMYGSIGKLGIAGRDLATNQAIVHFRTSSLISADYLFWFLLSQREEFGRSGKGATQKNISQTIVRRWPIAIPPMAEQVKISELIEELFTILDRARQAVVKAKERAEEVVRHVLKSEIDLLSGGKETPLRDVSLSVRNGMFVSRPVEEPDGVAILRISAVRPGHLRLGDLRYSGVAADEVSKRDYLLREGDLLFTRYSGNEENVGACAVVPRVEYPLTYPDKLIRVRVDRDRVDPRYLAMACSTGAGLSQIRLARKTTAGQVGISGRSLQGIKVTVPDMRRQREAVARYEEANQIVSVATEALARVGRQATTLRRSILREAMVGRLSRQDPSDESALVSLERSRALQPSQGRRPTPK